MKKNIVYPLLGAGRTSKTGLVMESLKNKKWVKILLIEDNPLDRKIIHEYLSTNTLERYEVIEADRLSTGLELISENNFDLILLDLFLPDARNLEALEKIIDYNPDIPIIILTGLGDEELGISAVRIGAQDYLIKGEFDGSLLNRALRYARERKISEFALRESENRFRDMFNSSSDLMSIMEEKTGKTIWYNPAWIKTLGYDSNTVGNSIEKIHPEDRSRFVEEWNNLLNERVSIDNLQYRFRNDKGEYLYLATTINPVEVAGNRLLYIVARNITEVKKKEEILRENEERYRILFNESPIGLMEQDFSNVKENIDILNQNGVTDLHQYFDSHPLEIEKLLQKVNVIDVNKASIKMYDALSKNDLINNFTKLFHEEKYEIFKRLILSFYKGKTVFEAECKEYKMNKDSFYVLYKCSIVPGYEKSWSKVFCSITDISDSKRWEKEIKNRLLKYDVQNGNLYFVKEPLPTISINAFIDLLQIGYSGLIISRTLEEEFRNNIKEDFKFIWLTTKRDDKLNLNDLNVIDETVSSLRRKTVVLIDRLEYLIFKHGFKEVLKIIFSLRELAYLNELIIILSIDPTAIQSQNVRMLEKEAKYIQPKTLTQVPEGMLAMLKVIYRYNSIGQKPSHSEIGNELNISKPTVRKRIKQLVTIGYLNEQKSGIRKILELTEKGYFLFHKNGRLNQSI